MFKITRWKSWLTRTWESCAWIFVSLSLSLSSLRISIIILMSINISVSSLYLYPCQYPYLYLYLHLLYRCILYLYIFLHFDDLRIYIYIHTYTYPRKPVPSQFARLFIVSVTGSRIFAGPGGQLLQSSLVTAGPTSWPWPTGSGSRTFPGCPGQPWHKV